MSNQVNPQSAVPSLPGQGVPPLPGQTGPAPKIDSKAPTETRLPKPLNDDRTKGIPFTRLLSVELRKMIDTRAGKVLVFATLALIVLVCGGVGWATRDNPTYDNMLGGIMIPLGYLLPILGIMTVTSEWSQRTGLITFTLQPNRLLVAAAKWLAALALTVVCAIAAFALAALFTWIASLIGGQGAEWQLSGQSWWTIPLLMLIYTSMGVAFGMLIQNTPGAICAYLLIPMVISMLNLFKSLRTPLEWINVSQTVAPLQLGEVTGEDWAKLGVSLLIWLVIPMVLGLIRLVKREVKSA